MMSCIVIVVIETCHQYKIDTFHGLEFDMYSPLELMKYIILCMILINTHSGFKHLAIDSHLKVRHTLCTAI